MAALKLSSKICVYLYQDNEVSGDEFAKAIQSNCVGKAYVDFPPAFKSFVTSVFKSIDIDGMWPFFLVKLAKNGPKK